MDLDAKKKKSPCETTKDRSMAALLAAFRALGGVQWGAGAAGPVGFHHGSYGGC